MRIAVVGSRCVTDYEYVKHVLDQLVNPDLDVIVSGGARGADSLARRYAHEYGMRFTCHEAEWNKWGKQAGFVRNKVLVADVDRVIAFHDGKSNGTKNTLYLARKSKIPVIVFPPDGSIDMSKLDDIFLDD